MAPSQVSAAVLNVLLFRYIIFHIFLSCSAEKSARSSTETAVPLSSIQQQQGHCLGWWLSLQAQFADLWSVRQSNSSKMNGLIGIKCRDVTSGPLLNHNGTRESRNPNVKQYKHYLCWPGHRLLPQTLFWWKKNTYWPTKRIHLQTNGKKNPDCFPFVGLLSSLQLW